MRLLTTLVAAALVATTGAAVAAPPAHHHSRPHKPDLHVPAMTATYANGNVTVAVYVTNKGRAKAGASAARVLLSGDATPSANDVVLGYLPIKKLRPGKTDYPIVPLAVPSSVPAGTYYVLACADATHKVKEKKEHDNCGAAPTTVTIPSPSGSPSPPGFVTVSWTASFGSVTATVTAGTGTCSPAGTLSSSGSCSLKTGDATVQLVASNPASGYTWQTGGWQGQTCDGVVSNDMPGTGATMTFTNPTADKSCTAVFPHS